MILLWGKMFSGIFLLYVLGAAKYVDAQAKIFVTAPSIFRLNIEETVSVLVSQPATVELFLRELPQKSQIISKKVTNFKANVPGIVKLKITEKDLPKSIDGTIQYELIAKSSKPVFQKTAKVILSLKNGTVFIQTDKPIYTPLQLVQYRIIPVKPDLLPSKQKIDVIIQNPNGIKVRKISKLDASDKGFVSDHFSLDQYAILGNWTIFAMFGDKWSQNSSINFEVREYVLPTFSVVITPPPYIAEEDKTFTVKVKSVYSYGKRVKGVLVLKLSVLVNKKVIPVFDSKSLLENDIQQLDVPIDQVLINKDIIALGFPFGAYLDIDATVIEEASGKKERAKDISAMFVMSPFLIYKQRTALYYKPGLPFNVMVDIVYTNKKPAYDVVVEIEAKVNGKVIASDRGAKMTDRTTEANEGKIQFTLDMPLAVVGNGQVDITVTASKPGLKKANLEFNILPYVSPSKSYLLVRSPLVFPQLQNVQIGEFINMEALIPNALNGISQISYLMISKGKIVDQGTKVREAGRITSIRIKVSSEMSPSVRFIAYYIRSGEVVVDSLLLKIGNKFGNKLEINVKNQNLAPGDDVLFNVKSSEEFGYFGLLGVDEAVYYLRNAGKLDSQRIGSELDTFDTGCGIGGGKDNSDVFSNAGVVILTDAALNVKVRNDISCKQNEKSKRKRRSINTSKEILDLNNKQLQICCKSSSCCANSSLSSGISFESCEDLADGLKLSPDCRLSFLRCCVFRFEDLGRSFDFFGDEAPDEIIEDVTQLQLRRYFPETWIWQEDDYKSLEKLYTVPDTITTWVVNGISVNNVTGLGVSEPIKIRGYIPFFIDAKMPYSVKRLEQISILAVVYNYGSSKLKVHLQLVGDQSFCSVASPGKPSKSLKFEIEGNSAQAIPFTITPLQTGEIPIQFRAYTSIGGDRIIKNLLVKPEGIEKIETKSITLDPLGILDDKVKPKGIKKDGHQTNIMDISIPDSYIPKSERVKVFLTGDLMTSIVTTIIEGGLQKLIRMPIGCGEQTMIKMAPNVYALQYLETLKTGVTAQVEKNAYQFMRAGYRRILGYRRADKSYSAWGSRRAGSIWLTSFVTKVMCQAKQFIKDDIDDKVICDSIDFVLANQKKDGSFAETTPVIHQEMIGGVKGNIPMTAFVLVSLLECGTACNTKLSGSTLAATVYLEMQITKNAINDKLTLAVVTYALALAKSPMVDKANTQLLVATTITVKNGQQMRFVEAAKGNFALNTEATAYALLAQLELDIHDRQGEMVLWLTEQRNARGSFHTTQDTCVALQALAKYSAKSSGGALDLKVELTSAINTDIKESFVLTPSNAFIRQEVDITSAIGGNIFIDTKGQGTAQLQIETRYNLPIAADKQCEFDVTVGINEEFKNIINDEADGVPIVKPKKTKSKKKCKKRRKSGKLRKKCRNTGLVDNNIQKDEVPQELSIQVCAKYNKPENTGQVMVEVSLLTGFEANVESLKKLLGEIDQYEIDGVKVSFYFEEIPSDKPKCISFTIERKFDVGLIQAAPVKVYRYYNPDSACTKFYHPKAGSELLKVICEGEECECGQGGCHECDLTGGKKVLTKQACTKADFVFRGIVLEISPQNTWQRISIRITAVIKTGKVDLKPGGKVLVYKLSNCPCPNFKEAKEYIFMLKDGLKYIIDNEAYVRDWPDERNVQDRYRGIFDTVREGTVCDNYSLDDMFP